MTGSSPEGPNLCNPSQTEASLSPEEIACLETPEGAATYLKDVHGYQLIYPRGTIDERTNYHALYAMQRLDRAVQYPDGRFQTNAEHSYAVARIAVHIADQYGLAVDKEQLQAYGLLHDEKEIYSKDTPVFDRVLLKTKIPRELAGRTLNREQNLKTTPTLAAHEQAYEERNGEAENLVHAADGLEAGLFTLYTKGFSQAKRVDDFEAFVEKQLTKAASHDIVFDISVDLMHEIASKWNGWGCKKIEGDPREIVRRIAGMITVKRWPVQQTSADLENAIIYKYTGETKVPSGLNQPVIHDQELARELGVTLLADRRAQKDRPLLPPTPAAAGLAVY